MTFQHLDRLHITILEIYSLWLEMDLKSRISHSKHHKQFTTSLILIKIHSPPLRTIGLNWPLLNHLEKTESKFILIMTITSSTWKITLGFLPKTKKIKALSLKRILQTLEKKYLKLKYICIGMQENHNEIIFWLNLLLSAIDKRTKNILKKMLKN